MVLQPRGTDLVSAGTLAPFLVVLSELLWLPQAACAAFFLTGLLHHIDWAPQSLGLLAAFVAIGVVRSLMQYGAQVYLDAAAEDEVQRIRRLVLERQDRYSPLSTTRLTSAAAAALIVEKLLMLKPFLVRYRPARLRVAIVPLAILLVSSAFSWAVGLIFLISGPVIPVFMGLVGLAAKTASERQMDEIGSLNSLLLDRLQAVVDIRLLDATERTVQSFDVAADTLRDRTMAVLSVAFLSSTVLELFSAIGVAMIAVYVGFSLLGEIGFGAYATPLTPFEGVFLLMLAPAFYQPLRDVASAWHDKVGATAVLNEVEMTLSDGDDTIPGHFEDCAATRGPAEIVITGLAVDIGQSAQLRFPDIQIALGDSVALTGPSGAGKTTLLSLIGGLARSSQGRIVIGGVPLTDDTVDGHRAACSFVPQKPHFFSGSLRANLTLGVPDANDADIEQALRLAHAVGVVSRLPGGLNAELGETGSGVSGGEARRLMIAKAALEDRAVLLIDEPTADLDEETAALIRDSLARLEQAGKTMIVATHDLRLAARLSRRIEV